LQHSGALVSLQGTLRPARQRGAGRFAQAGREEATSTFSHFFL
jgi:hypothetical protein